MGAVRVVAVDGVAFLRPRLELVVSLLSQRVTLVGEPADPGHGVVHASVENRSLAISSQGHGRMAIFAEVLVGLRVDVGCRD